MNWTHEQATAAQQEGWGVFEVIDHDDPSKIIMQVLQLHDRFPSHRAAQVFVIERAKVGSKLHTQALRAVVASRAPAKRAKRR